VVEGVIEGEVVRGAAGGGHPVEHVVAAGSEGLIAEQGEAARGRRSVLHGGESVDRVAAARNYARAGAAHGGGAARG
jgi:hypothetical protein